MQLTGFFNQTAVYWGTPASDGMGGFTFADPVEVSIRWEDRQDKYVSTSGEELISKAIVYLEFDLDVGGYLFLGSLTDLDSHQDPQRQAGANRIMAILKTPSLEADVFLRKIWL